MNVFSIRGIRANTFPFYITQLNLHPTKELEMKKIAIALVTAGMLFGLGVAPSNAINCNAFNQGTYQAAHVVGANGNGLYKIAMACHFG